MMLSIPKAFRSGVMGGGLLALSLTVPVSPAQAMPMLAAAAPSVTAQLAMHLMLSSQCYWFVHNRNGNRISYSSAPVGSGMTWGSSGFGCSKWGQ